MIQSIADLVAFLKRFHRHWMDDPSLDPALIPDDLPPGLATIYRELGALTEIESNRSPLGTQDSLVPLKFLRRIDGMIEFSWENQGNWSARCPLGQADPPVFCNAADVWNEPPQGFIEVCDSLDHFLITLCLQEAVLSCASLVVLKSDPAPEATLTIPLEPLWLNGWYAGGEASHDLYVSEDQNVLVMSWAGSKWVGSSVRDVAPLVAAGIEYCVLNSDSRRKTIDDGRAAGQTSCVVLPLEIRTNPAPPPLRITRAQVRAAGPGNLPGVCWRQWRTERELKRRGIDFRTTDPAAARRAYDAMTAAEFDAINGRQAWANWRTLGRALDGLPPDRPLVAVDLGCGTGESTRVLAHYLPAGSRILGVEFSEPLAAVARGRAFHHADGSPAAVAFVVGGATETYRDADGMPLPDGSVDLVNASGLFAHHLSHADVVRAAAEIARVLKPDGVAALDVGPHLPDSALTRIMRAAGFERLRRARSHPFDPTGQVVFRKRRDDSQTPPTSFVE